MIIVCTFFILSKLQQKHCMVALQYIREFFLCCVTQPHYPTMSIWILTNWWNSAHKHTHIYTIAFTYVHANSRRHIIFVWAIPFSEQQWMLLLFRMLPLSGISWIYACTHTHTRIQVRGCGAAKTPYVDGWLCLLASNCQAINRSVECSKLSRVFVTNCFHGRPHVTVLHCDCISLKKCMLL